MTFNDPTEKEVERAKDLKKALVVKLGEIFDKLEY